MEFYYVQNCKIIVREVKMDIKRKFIVSEFVEGLFFLILSAIVGFLVHVILPAATLAELAEIRRSDVVGASGTLFSLVTAFVLMHVWNDYSNCSRAIAEEAEALLSLWNYTDFLNSPQISAVMQTSLVEYIKSIITTELSALAAKRPIEFSSATFVNILKVLDRIAFDDQRDPVAFKALIEAFQMLNHARTDRITIATSGIPWFLRIFYLTTAFVLWLYYLIQGFNSTLLYYIILITITIIIILAYLLITDLDNPFAGLLQVPLDNYYKCMDFISGVEHEKTVTTIAQELHRKN